MAASNFNFNELVPGVYSDCTQVPCRGFYKYRSSHGKGYGGGGRCYCDENSRNAALSLNNHVWHDEPGTCKQHTLQAKPWYSSKYYYFQGSAFAQTWYNCSANLAGEHPNLNYVSKYCIAIRREDKWGWSYYTKPNVYTSPDGVKFAMRCEYPKNVAATCLRPDSTSTKIAKMVNITMVERAAVLGEKTILTLNIVGS